MGKLQRMTTWKVPSPFPPSSPSPLGADNPSISLPPSLALTLARARASSPCTRTTRPRRLSMSRTSTSASSRTPSSKRPTSCFTSAVPSPLGPPSVRWALFTDFDLQTAVSPGAKQGEHTSPSAKTSSSTSSLRARSHARLTHNSRLGRSRSSLNRGRSSVRPLSLSVPSPASVLQGIDRTT